MRPATRQRLRLSGGTELSFITAGEASQPAVLLPHGFPSSARTLILSWMRALPRMEAHIFDAGHLLLETHAAAAVSLMVDFIGRTQRESERTGERA